MNAEEVARFLRMELGPQFASIEVGPSNVQDSPHDYVFLYLSARKHEGPHVIVSDRQELEDTKGFLVGGHMNTEGEEPFRMQETKPELNVELVTAVQGVGMALLREQDRRNRNVR